MEIRQYNIYVNGKKVAFTRSLKGCEKALKQYPSAEIRTVIEIPKGVTISYVSAPYLA